MRLPVPVRPRGAIFRRRRARSWTSPFYPFLDFASRGAHPPVHPSEQLPEEPGDRTRGAREPARPPPPGLVAMPVEQESRRRRPLRTGHDVDETSDPDGYAPADRPFEDSL